MRKLLIAIVVILSVPVLALLVLYISQTLRQDDWKKRTTPLPEETKDLLCINFELPKKDSLCSGDKDIYALDFFNVARDTFRPYETYGIESREAATFDDVEERIGIYKYECEPVIHQADGLTYFSCSYDLRGDRKFIMTILYSYPEKAVMRILSTSRFDD